MTTLDEFVAHCRESATGEDPACDDCRESMVDDNNGYPGLCPVGLVLWIAMSVDEKSDAYDLVWPGCMYYTGGAWQNRPPEYCDNDTEPGSDYCAAHQAATGETDNSDEPVWGMEDD
jgi:hypothetical protein